ncbi:MAG: inositol monophosphatase [Candidatus Nomurabacteria bacterium]|jgi:fructose-1,6-bisphosphatase/inositol monophosphatase family enzyme|nr:inositol monophosphatase [Candidatus Nomurabacteria bacterium]
MNYYLEFAKKLAYDAGDIMLKYFGQTNISHYKGDDTIVTKADTEINQMVIDRVRAAYPNHGVYGEEDSFERDKNELWVCDPVDGTAMFARGVPTAVFSLAFVVDGAPQVGVVYDPFTDRLYTAIKGKGAFCNDEPMCVNDIQLADKAAVSNVDIWPEAEIFVEMSHLIDELNKKTYIVGIGSCINACMQVARGSFVVQAFAGTKGKNVDIAAAKVIVEEAGGRVTNIYGEEQRYDYDIKGAIVSNGVVHDEIISIIKGVK